MSRKKHRIERPITPDYMYNSVDVSRFINYLMLDGKKRTSEKIFYATIQELNSFGQQDEKAKKAGIELFFQALQALTTKTVVKARRVGGSTYQVPTQIDERTAFKKACTWLINAARTRNGKSMSSKLYSEIIDVVSGRGSSLKKKEEVMRNAESNRAFAHFA